jgi:hypothetical protein
VRRGGSFVARVTFGAALVLGLAGSAAGQPKAPAPAATGALPAGHPPTGEALPAGHPPTGEALPAGHPPTGEGLPAGHPQVNEGDEAPPAKGAHGAAAADPRFFNPPEDTAQDDPTLPPGVIVVVIKDAQNNPIPHAPITLGVLHSTVAKGESRERFAKDSDDSGAARFEGFAVGTGHSYRVSTTRGAASYAHPPVGLGDKFGKRVVVHAYDASAKVDDLAVAIQGLVYVSLREDSIQVEQLLSIYNLGPVAWTPDLTIQLPKGFKAFNKQESMDDGHVEEVSGTGAALRGTFAPGRHDIDFRYQIPLSDEARQTLKLTLPPRVAQSRVMAEASKSMGLEVTGFPQAQRTEGRDGKRLLVTEKQAARAEGGVPSLEITLTGLPTPGPGRWVAVVMAVLALGAGLAYMLDGGDSTHDEDARGDLLEAREALLGEIVALERAHKSGEVGPKAYARIRSSLLDALARIVTMLEANKSGPAARRKAEPA